MFIALDEHATPAGRVKTANAKRPGRALCSPGLFTTQLTDPLSAALLRHRLQARAVISPHLLRNLVLGTRIGLAVRSGQLNRLTGRPAIAPHERSQRDGNHTYRQHHSVHITNSSVYSPIPGAMPIALDGHAVPDRLCDKCKRPVFGSSMWKTFRHSHRRPPQSQIRKRMKQGTPLFGAPCFVSL